MFIEKIGEKDKKCGGFGIPRTTIQKFRHYLTRGGKKVKVTYETEIKAFETRVYGKTRHFNQWDEEQGVYYRTYKRNCTILTIQPEMI